MSGNKIEIDWLVSTPKPYFCKINKQFTSDIKNPNEEVVAIVFGDTKEEAQHTAKLMAAGKRMYETLECAKDDGFWNAKTETILNEFHPIMDYAILENPMDLSWIGNTDNKVGSVVKEAKEDFGKIYTEIKLSYPQTNF